MDQPNQPVIKEHLIAVYDLENFVAMARKLSLPETFGLLNELQILTIETLLPSRPVVIKNLGDANLMVFPTEEPDAVILGLLSLKEKIESFLHDQGFSNRAAFSAHYGEVIVGPFGREPFAGVDVFGEAVNVAFLTNGKPFRGRFNITPQLFRKLNAVTRKSFHKFTPPVTYLAE